MKIKLFFVVIFTFSNVCSISIIYSPPDKFDPEEYIFIGKVKSIISSKGTHPKNGFNHEYNGILVELEEEIYMPEKPKFIYEVYILSEDIPGLLRSFPKEKILTWYPVDAEIRIVAKKSKIDFDNPDEQKIRLEVSPYNQFQLSQNIKKLPSLISTRNSIYSYKNTKENFLISLANQTCDSLNIENEEERFSIIKSFLYQKDFELRKDLFRLHTCVEDAEKVRIIYRIKNFRYLGKQKLLNIIYEYIEDYTIRTRLIGNLFDIKFKDEADPIEWIIGK